MNRSVLSKLLRNRLGFGLAEVGPALAIGIIVSGAMIATFNMNMSIQQGVRSQVELANFNSEIINRLADDNACEQSFQGTLYNGTGDRAIKTIFGPPNFTIGTWSEGRLVEIVGMDLLDSGGTSLRKLHSGTIYYGDFRISYRRINQPQPEPRIIRLALVLDQGNFIQTCRALIGKANHLWTPTFNNANSLQLHYLGGALGIGPNMGAIQPLGASPPLQAPPGSPRIDQVYNGVPVTKAATAAAFSRVANATAYRLDIGSVSGIDSFSTTELRVSGDLFISGRARIRNSLQVNNSFTGFFWTSSDRRLKDNIVEIEHAFARIEDLRPVTFCYRQRDSKRPDRTSQCLAKGPTTLGYIAQDVEKSIPEIVGTSLEGYKTLSYHQLIPYAIQGIQEIDKESLTLFRKIERIESQQERIRHLLAKKEASVNSGYEAGSGDDQ